MKWDFHILVIGAGSGGLVVASGAAGLGAKVGLIEGHKMGGDCLNYGCVPSKAFLRPAHLAKDIQNGAKFGLSATLNPVDAGAVMAQVQSVIKAIEPHDSVERYTGLGVTCMSGMGEMVDPHTVRVGDKTYTAKWIVLSTGSEAVIPPIPGLNEVSYLTNKTVFSISHLPKHLIVLGAGPIGLELGQGFRHLGSQVTVIDMAPGLFGKDEPEVGPMMEKVMREDGIALKLGHHIKSVSQEGDTIRVVVEQDGQTETVSGSDLLVSLGRRPVTDTLNLDQAGVAVNDRGFLVVNDRLQTTQSHIYGCGDIVGPYQFTHMAGYQAGIVLRNMIFKWPARVNYSAVPWTTYTKPEVAHVGYTEPWAQSLGIFEDKIIVDLNDLDRAKADVDTVGFLKLNLGPKKRIIGATFVGEKAGEMMPIATLAIQQKLKASAFMNLIFSYPTQAEIYKFASLTAVKQSFKPWMKSLIQKILL